MAGKLAAGNDADNDDPNMDRVEMDREARPRADGAGDLGEEDPAWAMRSAEERVSAAGPAVRASDRLQVAGTDASKERWRPGFGVVFNPKNYPWTEQEANVQSRECERLKGLTDKWYGKAAVGDGAEAVVMHGRSLHTISRHRNGLPCRSPYA